MKFFRLIFLPIFLGFVSVFSTAAEPPQYRGAMISPGNFHAADLEVFGGRWNGNLVRWQLNWGFPHGKADTATAEEYFAWLENECRRLDAMLPLLKEYGVKVCLDVHTAPGGFTERTTVRALEEEEFTDAFIETWVRLATRYKENPVIWGYDLLNEPVERTPEEGEYYISWRDLATRAARRIREIDPTTPIVFEPANWASLRGFEGLEPLDLPNIIYSPHMYVPHAFTHQGVFANTVPVTYPGEIDGAYWGKEELRKSLAPVLEFQKKYDVPIFIGEFSAIRWAPGNGAYNYLKDVIEIFEEYGWDWTYHAFREWSGWSVEYTDDRENNEPAPEPTNRELLLRSFFERNSRKVD